MEPNAVMTPLSTGVGLALLVPWVIQRLKESPYFPWINEWTDAVARALSLGAALVGSVGITYSFDAEAGKLVIDGLTVGAAAQLLFQVLAQWRGQEFVYRAAIKPAAKS